jgi:16S rRNA (guanine527-N7)-methyltransferase
MSDGFAHPPASRASELAAELELPRTAAEQLAALLTALAAERDAPTTVRDPGLAFRAHVVDSLAALRLSPVREARRIADLGAGAGFPGLPLAIAISGASVDLIEATRRKCAVIERLIAAAKIGNARAVAERAETWAGGEGREAYDVVTARAVASLAVLAEYAAPLLRRGGVLVAWKGKRDAGEERAGHEAAARVGMAIDEVVRLEPRPEARDRHLHVLSKREATPPQFPRRPGRAAKRPLA